MVVSPIWVKGGGRAVEGGALGRVPALLGISVSRRRQRAKSQASRHGPRGPSEWWVPYALTPQEGHTFARHGGEVY